MSYKVMLSDGTSIIYQAVPSIKDGVLLLLNNKQLIASYSAGVWKSITLMK